jgi:hypothetical protein
MGGWFATPAPSQSAFGAETHDVSRAEGHSSPRAVLTQGRKGKSAGTGCCEGEGRPNVVWA